MKISDGLTSGAPGGAFSLRLLGQMSLQAPDGTDLTPRGTRARVLLAMLAVAPQGIRGRRWLQDHIWSSRDEQQGSASLRQCLSEIRRSLGKEATLLNSNRQSVWLDLPRIRLDLNDLDGVSVDGPELPEFLEGLDVPDPEFENWVRDQRTYWETRLAEQRARRGREHPDPAAAPAESPSGGPWTASTSGTPVIAVMPFSQDQVQHDDHYLVEGVAHELIEQLSRIRWLATIARSSSYATGLSSRSPVEFARELNADYVVKGKAYRADGQLSVHIELIRAEGSVLLWSGQFSLSDAVSSTSFIAGLIAASLDTNISNVEQRKAQSSELNSEEVTQIIWRGRWHLNRHRKDDSIIAEEYFRRALALEPHNAEAHIQLAWCILWRVWATRGDEERILAGRAIAQDAILLDSGDARGYWLVGTADSWLRRLDSARLNIEEAIRLCPSMALAHAQMGSNFNLSGQPERALAPIDMAIRLSPRDQHLFYFLGERAMANWLLGRFEEAVQAADLAILKRSSYWYAHMIKYLSLCALKRKEEAKEAGVALFMAKPNLDADDIGWLPFVDRSINEMLIDSLGLARDSGERALRHRLQTLARKPAPTSR